MTETFRFAPPYALPTFPVVRPRELDGDARRHRIAIVGGGLAGLTLACDLARRGIEAVLLDEDDTVGVKGASSRGICYAQKTLELFERLGIYERIADRGVTWSVGRTWSRDEEVYRFDLGDDSASRQPPFVNLQQFYVEWFLVDRIAELGVVEMRWKSRVGRVELHADHATVEVSTPLGDYVLEADWLIDASGANSPLRDQLALLDPSLDAHPSRGTDRWCISDVRFTTPLPTERWTWVDADFNEGRAVWQHLMGDAVWRMDYQMAEDCDVDLITRPEVAGARLRAQLGPDVDFEFVWIGPYQYRDHLLDTFRRGPLFFIGDAAHVVSPFGARGGNTGIQDAGNLGWKLALVVQGDADARLLDSYDAERRPAAAENLRVTSRTARFIAPRSAAEHRLRRAVLALARRFEFARALVNTGRMSQPNAYPGSSVLPGGGRSVQNLPLRRADGRTGTLMALLADDTRLLVLWFAPTATALREARERLAGRPVRVVAIDAEEPSSIVDHGRTWAVHLGAEPGHALVVRPDAYLAATIPRADATAIVEACVVAGALRSPVRMAPATDAVAMPATSPCEAVGNAA